METVTLKKRIEQDFIQAFKANEERKKSALSMLKAKIIEGEKANKNQPLSEDEVLKVILASVKQRKQSIEEFQKAGRKDLAEKESRELAAIEVYLPSQMTEDEIRAKALEILSTMNPGDPKTKRVGMTMGIFNKNFRGMFDTNILKKLLEEIA
ncbi:MAG: GatB/YqeY domain-containing protein [Smithella sp.]